jgi:hypothetical protein
MKKFLIFFLFSALCFQAVAVSRMGTAEVRISGDTPCFNIAHAEYKRTNRERFFHGYTVYSQGERIWGYNSKPMLINENDCYPYGVLPEGAEVITDRNRVRLSDTAPPLQLNTLYSVGVYVDREGATIGYGVKFCLQKQNGSIIVEQSGASSSCDQIKEELLKKNKSQDTNKGSIWSDHGFP